MTRNLRRFALLLLLLIAVAVGAYVYLQRQFQILHTPPSAETIIEIPSGLGAREVVRLLHQRGIIDNENVATAYLILSGNRSRLRAGEYMFNKPMTVPEIMEKIATGAIHLHKFTVPEGLTLAETAMKWQEQGFGDSEEFITAARESVALVQDLDAKADSLEGYLFPETYSFPKRTSAKRAVEAMVGRFKHVLEQLQKKVPTELWPADIRETVILASLVESEAAVDDERELISSVYWNRLKRKILLQCDTTVVYALKGQNKYNGRLTTADLRLDSPYNTYRYSGLPPSAITNPGFRSLEAAIQPATTPNIFFVRTEGGRHTFTSTLAAHNRAVAKYRVMQRKAK